MKRLLSTFALTALTALCLCGTAAIHTTGAATIHAARVIQTTRTSQSTQTSQATQTARRTMLHIAVVVEKQQIVAGPYARYAQKYLGVTAPLSDKVMHRITDVKISDIGNLSGAWFAGNSTGASSAGSGAGADAANLGNLGAVNPGVTGAANYGAGAANSAPSAGFPKLPVDRMSAVPPGPEESARQAALKIFEIRRNRYELITGEVGENVFGAGLGSAIEELTRLEEEYLALFLGKQLTTTHIGEYEIVPVKGTLDYVVCRFSESDGLHPKDFIEGAPVVLTLRPVSEEGSVGEQESKSGGRGTLPVYVAADMECRVIYESAELAAKVMPVEQFGRIVYINM